MMRFPNYDIARDFIIKNATISYDDSFDLAKLAGQLLRIPEQAKFGRDLVIRAKDALVNKRMDQRLNAMWNELVVSAGLYPYVEQNSLSAASLVCYEYHKSDHLEGVYFHEDQLNVSMALREERPVILSAPTSYGKSLLIEDVVASGRYRNLVIIQPTLALLDETRKKLSKYRSRYRLIVSTSQSPAEEKGNIFLFTGERVLEYSQFPPIEFFVIDEFYKLSMERGDDRAIVLNQAFYKMLKQTRNFYMLGPYIKSIPEEIIKKLGVTWKRTEFATVAVDETMLLDHTKKIGKRKEKEERKKKLFELLKALKDPALVYVASPATCTNLAIEYTEFLQQDLRKAKKEIPRDIDEMCEWIAGNINGSWSLIDALTNGVGFHHGALPRHLGSSIVDAFNNSHLKVLFCTATLIEGVNTSAKHVILFEKKKGTTPIDFFDYKNIAGRSGRMKKHYVGNVIRFEKEPPQIELEVDIPILSQQSAPIEMLLALDKADIEPSVQNKLDSFNRLEPALQELLRRNSTVDIQAQLNILSEIEEDYRALHPLLSWNSNFFSFDQLNAVVELAWKHLAKAEDRKRIEPIGNLSARWLTTLSINYNQIKSIGGMINNMLNQDFWMEKVPDYQARVNYVTFAVLQISRNFFDYKLPKWLTVIEGLQAYIYGKYRLQAGNYTFLASQLENGFLEPSLAALREYDIPVTAIRKLKLYLSGDRSTDQTMSSINRLADQRLQQEFGLDRYEIRKIKAAYL